MKYVGKLVPGAILFTLLIWNSSLLYHRILDFVAFVLFHRPGRPFSHSATFLNAELSRGMKRFLSFMHSSNIEDLSINTHRTFFNTIQIYSQIVYCHL